jgi:hypothetical protein
MSNNFKINLTKVNNILGEDLYNGSIKLKDLFGDGTIEGRNFFVPVYNPHSSDITQPDSGYQREAKPKRVSDVMNRIVSPIPGTSIPNKEPFIDSVNLNILASDASIYVKPLKKNEDDFGDFFVFDYISNIGKFRVLDGQTRIKGALAAWLAAKENNDHQLAQEIGDTRVSITLSFCADIFKEAYIFYLINQYSKVIPPDGATRLLFEGVKKGKIEFVNEVTRADKETLIESMAVAEKLSKNSNVWAGHIRDFNESGGGKMSIRAVAKIIEPIYKRVKADTVNSSKAAEDIVFDITEAYWSGIKLAYPMMFAPGTATKYNILKAGPSEIMMMVLEKVYDVKQGNGAIVGNLTDPKTFKKLMKATLDQHKDKNRDDVDVSAEKLFLSGVGGAVGKYSNNAAKKEASRLINRSLFEQLNIVTP